MLADQFKAAATTAPTTAATDELAHKLWCAHAEGILTDADAKDISEVLQARRAALSDQRPVLGLPRALRRLRARPREKLFGDGRPEF